MSDKLIIPGVPKLIVPEPLRLVAPPERPKLVGPEPRGRKIGGAPRTEIDAKHSDVARDPSRWPRWVHADSHLREVAPLIFVSGEAGPRQLPPDHDRWHTVVAFIASAQSYRNADHVVKLPFSDGEAFPAGHLDHAAKAVVRAYRDRRPVLIHCMMGVSRSASAAYAIIRALYDLDHDEALRRLKVPDWTDYPMPATLASARAWNAQLRNTEPK